MVVHCLPGKGICIDFRLWHCSLAACVLQGFSLSTNGLIKICIQAMPADLSHTVEGRQQASAACNALHTLSISSCVCSRDVIFTPAQMLAVDTSIFRATRIWQSMPPLSCDEGSWGHQLEGSASKLSLSGDEGLEDQLEEDGDPRTGPGPQREDDDEYGSGDDFIVDDVGVGGGSVRRRNGRPGASDIPSAALRVSRLIPDVLMAAMMRELQAQVTLVLHQTEGGTICFIA